MAHRKQSRCTTHIEEDRTRRSRYSLKHAEQLAADECRYSRYKEPDRVQSGRKRWAAGYIDPPSCTSYAYISTRHQSPDLNYSSDMESIPQTRSIDSDYIETRGQRNMYNLKHTNDLPRVSTSRYHSSVSHLSMRSDCGLVDEREPYFASDVEDLDHDRPREQATTSTDFDSDIEEGSDIVIINRRDGDSDIGSLHSRHDSTSRSDRYSIKSCSIQSDVQNPKRRNSNSESDSDDEGGYISLDDYITDRSDCVSKRSLSGDDGEGSDIVGSDVEEVRHVGEGSDVTHGSDVASLSDDGSFDNEEDCIDDGCYRTLNTRE